MLSHRLVFAAAPPAKMSRIRIILDPDQVTEDIDGLLGSIRNLLRPA